ncbi:MAG TPA: hypothetical protein VE088_01195 [Gaiellaceae bacterium]|jgi:hypothetical protein|nr:hypothetical protein [Gaiellaceae bacterium]
MNHEHALPGRVGFGVDLYCRRRGVGSRLLGWSRLFRYEVRRWLDGEIPDVAEAVESPRRLTDDPLAARRLLDLVPLVPTPVWGRDELGTGDMWNSNSLVSWLIVSAGLDIADARLPGGGRAPGWDAGVTIAGRPPPGSSSGGWLAVDDDPGESVAMRFTGPPLSR